MEPKYITTEGFKIHYLESEKELVITDGFVKKIIFHKGEDLKSTDATFIYIQEAVEENKQITNAFVQVMNNGKYELLKLNTRTLSQKDSLFGTVKAYRFVNNTKYFIYNSHKAEPIKKLSPDFILPFFIHAESYNEWIAKNKIDLKKEADVVRFINYYNSIATPTN